MTLPCLNVTQVMQDGGWCWYQDPRVVVSPATIVIAPEFKQSDPATAERALNLAHA